jgi:hypothetical protein
MDLLFELIFQIVAEVLGAVLEGFLKGGVIGEWLTSDTREWIGFSGVSAWLVLSFGRVQWENKDWRAVGSGLVLLAGGLILVVWAGFSHYQSSYTA